MTVILSTAKLRERFSQLYLKTKKPTKQEKRFAGAIEWLEDQYRNEEDNGFNQG